MAKLKNNLPDLLLLAGAASVSYGAWLVYAPAGYLTAGALAIIGGLRLATSMETGSAD